MENVLNVFHQYRHYTCPTILVEHVWRIIHVILMFIALLSIICLAGNPCEGGWVDLRANKLGCLLFERSVRKYAEARKYCQDLNAHLVEVLTQDQMNFLRNYLRNTYGQKKGCTSHADATGCVCWWGGATERQNGRQNRAKCGSGIETCGRANYYWPNSGQPVGAFIWAKGDPDKLGDIGEGQGFCFYGHPSPWWDFMGIDWPAHMLNPFICQKKCFPSQCNAADDEPCPDSVGKKCINGKYIECVPYNKMYTLCMPHYSC